jgi:hypothetical protein
MIPLRIDATVLKLAWSSVVPSMEIRFRPLQSTTAAQHRSRLGRSLESAGVQCDRDRHLVGANAKRMK